MLGSGFPTGITRSSDHFLKVSRSSIPTPKALAIIVIGSPTANSETTSISPLLRNGLRSSVVTSSIMDSIPLRRLGLNARFTAFRCRRCSGGSALSRTAAFAALARNVSKYCAMSGSFDSSSIASAKPFRPSLGPVGEREEKRSVSCNTSITSSYLVHTHAPSLLL